MPLKKNGEDLLIGLVIVGFCQHAATLPGAAIRESVHERVFKFPYKV
jgi:hypothetical protein